MYCVKSTVSEQVLHETHCMCKTGYLHSDEGSYCGCYNMNILEECTVAICKCKSLKPPDGSSMFFCNTCMWSLVILHSVTGHKTEIWIYCWQLPTLTWTWNKTAEQSQVEVSVLLRRDESWNEYSRQDVTRRTQETLVKLRTQQSGCVVHG